MTTYRQHRLYLTQGRSDAATQTVRAESPHRRPPQWPKELAMTALMTPRTCLALLAVVALTAVPGALAWGNAVHAQLRLGDVGDGWRALLLGAPPAFL